MIEHLETQLIEAAINLSLFESANRNSPPPNIEDWETDSKRKQELVERYQAEFQISTFDTESYLKLYELAEIDLKREKWAKGELPRSYIHRFPFIHAKSFLYNLDAIGNILKVLSKIKGVPQEVIKAKESFTLSFPNLRKVRNSSQHIEDRGRGLGIGQQPLQLKPIDNFFIKATGGVLVLESLNGNCFGSTMDNGEYGEVEISLDSLLIARECIQNVINAFEWEGPPQHRPY